MNYYDSPNARQRPRPQRPRPPFDQTPPGSGRPPFFQQPGFPQMPPFEQPSDFPSTGSPSGPPTGAPPSFEPQASPSLFNIDPGAIRPCTYQYVYLWLKDGRSFWAWLTFVGRRSVAGWRWDRFRWTYFGTDLDNISSFVCF